LNARHIQLTVKAEKFGLPTAIQPVFEEDEDEVLIAELLELLVFTFAVLPFKLPLPEFEMVTLHAVILNISNIENKKRT
jgi:hypothetical protein